MPSPLGWRPKEQDAVIYLSNDQVFFVVAELCHLSPCVAGSGWISSALWGVHGCKAGSCQWPRHINTQRGAQTSRGKALLLRVKRSHLRCICSGCLLGTLHWRFSRHIKTVKDFRLDPQQTGDITRLRIPSGKILDLFCLFPFETHGWLGLLLLSWPPCQSDSNPSASQSTGCAPSWI